MLGTWINTGTVVAGALAGLAIGDHLPDRVKRIVLTALGLVTLWIGVQMSLKGTRPFLIIGSLIVGGVLGELLRIEDRLSDFARWLQARVKVGESAKFVRGFVSASVLFCVGPMTVVGSITDGLTGDSKLLITKAIMDGFAATALAATTGVGVLFAAVTVLLVQAPLTLLGSSLAPLTEPNVLNQFEAVGGLIIVGLGFRLLEVRDIPVANVLPALLLVAVIGIWF